MSRGPRGTTLGSVRRLSLLVLPALFLAACGAGSGPGPTGTATSHATLPATSPTMPESPSNPVETGTPASTPTLTAAPPPSASARPTPSASAPPASLAGAEWSRLPTTDHVVALTFDAGGNDAGVASILATLADRHVPGTFFLTGRWCQVYPQEAARIAAAYTVGNHTYSHPHLTELDDAAVRDEVLRGEAAIRVATGDDPHPLFRFPYGDSDSRTIADVHALGYGGIRWTVDTLGWKGRSAGQSVDTVISRVRAALAPGAIVLMHVGAAEDGSTLDADALPSLIDDLRARGYTPVAITAYVR